MSFLNWVPALSSTFFFGLALWLLRKVITTRLTRSVQHEFDQKLEKLRTELRNSEESFKADLRLKEDQILTLRSGAMSALASRQAALDNRRLEAVDQIWSSVGSLALAKGASAYASVIKFKEASAEAAKNPKMRAMFDTIASPYDMKLFKVEDAHKARPFVSPMVWAIFSAYQSILMIAVAKLHILKLGGDNSGIFDFKHIDKLIKMALPHQSEYVEKYGDSVYHYLVEELEGRLLEELRKMLDGSDADKASIAQAAEILKESERLRESIAQAKI